MGTERNLEMWDYTAVATESCGNREEPRDVGLCSCGNRELWEQRAVGTERNLEMWDYTDVATESCGNRELWEQRGT